MATLRNHPGYWLRDDAAAAFDRAEADHGVFIVNSAGRTVAEQQALIDRWNRGGAANRPPYLYRPANPATSSNHVSGGGKALDIADWRRFAQVCGNYGFVHSYPGSDPVHFDYVGGSGSGQAAPNGTVQAQQNWLISRGYDLGPTGADGIAGPMYAAAVQKYQTFLRAYGYTGDIDGIWGAGTQAAHAKYYEAVNSQNVALKDQQNWLISRGYDLGPSGADGINGPKTHAAIKGYQTFLRAWGYTGDIDGQWGPGTQAAHEKYAQSLVAQPTVPAFPLPAGKYFGPEADPNSISGWHSYNAELKQWQQRMKDRGWPITVDGLYGPKGATTPQGNTAEITVAFQKEKGLTPDGLIGPKTWAAAWTAPVTPAPPTPADPKPTEPEPTDPTIPDDEAAATPNLISPEAKDFPSWIRFETVLDSDGQGVDHNKKAAEYYGKPYNPVESHIHWWGEPGKGGSHDGNVSYIRNTKDLSVNFVVSPGRVTLMVPLNKIALTTGQRNPFGWKSENDPTITDLSDDELGYRTMGYLHYIVEKLNPNLLDEPIRHHKEFYATSCSMLDKAKVRFYAEQFRTGAYDPTTGKPSEVDPPVEVPLTVQVNKDFYDNVLKRLPGEFRQLADDLDEGLV